MTYTPDAKRYQQLNEPITGRYDCSAYSAAWITDAHTGGATKLTGRAIRLASSEPIPDRSSPGLNLTQVDAAVYKLTSGRVNLDTRTGIGIYQFRDLVKDGRWAILQVNRGVLVDKGFGGGNGFRGGHAITVHFDGTAPIIGDPLVPYYIRTGWSALYAAAGALVINTSGTKLGYGRANVSLTRDLTPDYRVRIAPTYGDRVAFWQYLLGADGKAYARSRAYTGGFSATCTPPRWVPGPFARSLVRLTSGSRAGQYVDARYAEEVIP